MLGIAGKSHALLVEYEWQHWRGCLHAQLGNLQPTFTARSYREHRPVFEEGQRLPQHLLDSLLSSYGRHSAAGLTGNVPRQIPKKSADGAARFRSRKSDKRHSAGEFIESSTESFSRDDHCLFSFDDIPAYVEDDDDTVDIYALKISKLNASTSVQNSNTLEGCSSGISHDQYRHDQSTIHTVPNDNFEDACNHLDRFHDSNLKPERRNADEALMQRNDTIQLPELLQCTSASRLKSGYKEHCTNVTNNFGHGAASHEKGDVLSQQHHFDMEFLSHPLGGAFNQFHFARSYNLVALQVSLLECDRLANSLKGHLLNWPRINNIARVQGDDMNWDTKSSRAVKKRGKVEGFEDSILHAVYGTLPPEGQIQMEKRVKSAKTFSSRHLPYLQSISRLGRKAFKVIKEEKEKKINMGKQCPEKYYMVELLNSCQNEESNLNFPISYLDCDSKRWRGPFRLLLLDPKYARREAQLPMTVQMYLKEFPGYGKGGQRRQIVPCRLTLFYEYWSMEEVISSLAPFGETSLLPILVLGHVAMVYLGEHYSSVKFYIGKVILDKHRPVVKTVVNKTAEGEAHRPPILEVLAGNHSLVTTIIENDVQFLVNLAKVRWDPELAAERWRLLQKFSNKDIVCDVFAGAGDLALLLAKKVRRVFANDPNEDALKYLTINIADNGLHAKVELYNLDCLGFLRQLLAFKRPVIMTQIVYNLPTPVEMIIDSLQGAFIRETWPQDQALPTVHVYGYGDTSDPQNDFRYLIMDKLRLAADAVDFHFVKPCHSGGCLIYASFQLPDTIAFNTK